MGDPVETVAPTADLLPRPTEPPAEEPPKGDWYVKLIRKRDQRKYYIHEKGMTTARVDHLMLLPEEVAKQFAAALRKNHPDFTAVAKKCPKRFLHPEQGKPKKKSKRQPILTHAMEDLASLLLCPFCGGQPFLDSSCSDKGKWFSVRCSTCNCQTDEKATAKAAVNTWNRRFQSKQ